GGAAPHAGDALCAVLLCPLVVLVAAGPPVAGALAPILSRAVACARFRYAVGAGLFLLIRTVVPRPGGPRHA
ncbi:hypothetical protein, partial [Streptomyces albidochromogenes]